MPHAVALAVGESSLPLPSLAGEKLIDVLRLIRTPSVGPVTCFELIRRFGSAAEALDRLPELARRGGRVQPLQVISVTQAEQEIEAAEAFGARLVRYGEADYPALLHMITDPPPILTIIGDAGLWTQHSVAMVGARNASANGCALAKKLAAALGEAGVTVVSGLARGIDTFAHQGALKTGTVGVIGNGIDVVYPPENACLVEEMRAHGAIVTEQPFGAAPFAAAFPGRNRIIAGMSAGTLVVEAAPKSGSLITARFANEQGREVFAIPGNPLDPRAKGCNQLLKAGATLVESVEDILQALAASRPFSLREWPLQNYNALLESDELSEVEAADIQSTLLARIGLEPVSMDELRMQCAISPAALFATLTELELAGRVVRVAGNKVCLSC